MSDTNTYDVEFLVHQNEVIRVEAADENEAYELGKVEMLKKITTVEGYRGADWDFLDVKRVAKTHPALVERALTEYRRVVERNGTQDNVIRAMRDEPGYEGLGMSGPTNIVYEVAEGPVDLDLDDENVVKVLMTGLAAMCALWEFEQVHG